MGKKLLVLHGPNLNLLGEREGTAGGRFEDLNSALRSRAASQGLELKIVQSNHEGVLIDTLHAERRNIAGVVVNPSGLFGSHALKDALEAIGVPAVEVHLDGARTKQSVVKEACKAQISGKGFDSYFQALERFAQGEFGEPVKAPTKGKTLGRKVELNDAEPPAKTLGRKAEAPAASPAKALARTAEAGTPSKTLGRKGTQAADKPAKGEKTLGRGSKGTPAADMLTRALVREKIAERLSGKLTPAGLATWARAQWMEVQRGAPAESGYRDMLEDSLQTLTLSTMPASRLSDEQLVDLMTQLEG
ncbi:type II 3-dehydroquinate dehydratase [Hyalangium rubrum]|uniref:3-dehydroquinate dehydratase n=1 Tax=Hyalangium rubrum TaxID=3103134 RepID=A0ABU5HF36_9BACT|nr:type II 3-dehydroquinate dehydratase [Hyalangium sp. s54d21]MDY7231744.1 type II 3-dehydroquinate dehydratase [Hyalangium sp. s54d21]